MGHENDYRIFNKTKIGYPVKIKKQFILRERDILRRNNLFHLISLSSEGSVSLGNTLGASNIDLYPMKPSNKLFLTQTPILPTSSDSTSKSYATLAAGYYGVSFRYDPSGSAGSTYYQSNSYDCIRVNAFTDERGIFEPCVKRSATTICPDGTTRVGTICVSDKCAQPNSDGTCADCKSGFVMLPGTSVCV